ncbi:BCCT-family transporter [Escherichia coli]|uniref:BCCT-family transporter n=1 Tax=Escherichia coli TaxID=562 RepID=A0A377CG16_ECOLX|nr:BCCT-family transporter [Escherichia coli]
MAYHFHVRKNKGLSLSGIIAAITGVRPQGPWGKLVDLMFLIATVGALTIPLCYRSNLYPWAFRADRFTR